SVVVTEPQLSAVRRFYRQDFNGSGILSDLSEISDGTDLDAGDRVVVSVEISAMGGMPDDLYSNAFDLALSDTLPAHVSYVPGSARTGPITGAATAAGVAVGTLALADPTVAGRALTWDSNADPADTVDLDIPEGQTLIINYIVTIDDTAGPNQALDFSAGLQWTSLDGVVDGERTGTDGSAGLNDYSLDSIGTIKVSESTAFTLEVISDTYDDGSAGAASDGRIRVGDLIEYQLIWNVQEGTTAGASATLALPLGVAFAGVSAIESDASVSTTTVVADFSTVTAVGNPATAPTALTLMLANIVNTGTTTTGSDATDELRVRFFVRTLNEDAFTPDPTTQMLLVSATANYDGREGNITGEHTLTLLQPLLAADLNFNIVQFAGATTTIVGVNDTVNWMLDLSNTDTAPAYNPIIDVTVALTSRQLMLTTGNTYTGTLTVTAADGTTQTPQEFVSPLPVDFAQTGTVRFETSGVVIPPGASAVFRYETIISDTVGAGMDLPGSAQVERYFSLDSANLPTVAPLPDLITAAEIYEAINAENDQLAALTPLAGNNGLSKQLTPNQTMVSIGEPFDYRLLIPQQRTVEAGTEHRGIFAEVAFYDVRLSDQLVDADAGRYLYFLSSAYITTLIDTTPPDTNFTEEFVFVVPDIVNDNPASATTAALRGAGGGLDVLAGTQAELSLRVLARNNAALVKGSTFANTASFVFNRVDGLGDNPDADQVVDGGNGTSPALTIIEPDLIIAPVVYERGTLTQANDINTLTDFSAEANVLAGAAAAGIRFDRGVTNRLTLTVQHAADTDPDDGVDLRAPAYEVSTAIVLPRAATVADNESGATAANVGLCEYNPATADGAGVSVQIAPVANAVAARVISAEEYATVWTAEDCTLTVTMQSATALNVDEQMIIRLSTRLDELARDGYNLNVQARVQDYSSYSPALYNDTEIAALGADNLRTHIRTYPLPAGAVAADSARVEEINLTVEAPEIVVLKQATNLTARADFFRRDFPTHVSATTAQAGDRIEYTLTLINIGALGVGPIFSADPESIRGDNVITLVDTPSTKAGVPSRDRVWARGTILDRDVVINTGDYTIPLANAEGGDVITETGFDGVQYDEANLAGRGVNYLITPGTANPSTVDSFSVIGFNLAGADARNASVLRVRFVVRLRGDAPDRSVAVNQSVLTGVPGFAEVLSHQYRDNRNAPINECYDLTNRLVRAECVPSLTAAELETEVLSLPVVSMKKSVVDLDNDGIYDIGDTIRYEITAVNVGSIDSTLTRVVDHLPAGASYVLNSTLLNGVAVPDRPRASGEDEDDQRMVSALEEGLVITANGLQVNEDGNRGRMPRSRANGGNLDDAERTAIITFDARINADLVPGAVIVNQAFSDGAAELTGLVGAGAGAANDADRLETFCNDNNLSAQLCSDFNDFSTARLSYTSPPSDDPTTDSPNDPTILVVGDGARLAVIKEVLRKDLNGATDEVDATDTFTYRIVAHNDGPVPVTGVRVADPIPDEMAYLPGSTVMISKRPGENGAEDSETRLEVADRTVAAVVRPPFGADIDTALWLASSGELAEDAEEAVIMPGHTVTLTFDVRVLANRISDNSALATGDVISN
ncbi:MAG: DUF11 domain-containing protein, partial [Proteobacteria bacterium]|nr:DUF11 domain-containing protein [Pseudomonadota bacterium]